MAEEKSAETEQPAPPTAKSGVAKLLPLIGGIVGGIVLGGVLGFTLLGPKLSHKTATTPAATASTKAAKEGAPEIKKGDAPPPIYEVDNLVMNPAGSGGSHFLLMSVALQLKDAGSLETIKGRDAELRDAILRLFSRKTSDQIADITARDQFGVELMGVMDKMFGAGTVAKIYFPQFVIQ
jgi:flagellar FliL protein